jgi:hypothetical protein
MTRAMAARISAPRIWVRLRFTAKLLSHSRSLACNAGQAKRNCDSKRVGRMPALQGKVRRQKSRRDAGGTKSWANGCSLSLAGYCRSR